MSDTPARVTDFEAPQSLRHQQREWAIERVGWGLMALIVLAALLGGLGSGPLGSRSAESPDGSLRLRFFAVERYAAPQILELWAKPLNDETTPLELAFSRTFTDEITIEQIVPEPESMTTEDGKLVLRFNSSDSTEESKVVVRYKHDGYGLLDYEVGIGSQEPIRVRQLVLP